MNKHLILLFSLIILSSCNQGKFEESQSKVDSLLLENYNLKNKISHLESILEKRNQPKYVWTVVHHKRGYFVSSYDVDTGKNSSGFKGTPQNYIYYSEIETIKDFDESKKFKLQDELERELRNQFGTSVHSIQKRETFVFESYEKASQHRYKYIN